ncbi:NlpC/P60 family protein [Streptomyces sp. SL13]|uniref:NlpC/P60 family protein n=1 Tax=Streptantibioticus silvisoli TaxID=2705255 RepID=A0AA90K8L5_9ACTN|nr:NlpC/P60 family protein [Streptantibioticus silvisoli]MDI5963531.1 NlpC/P60 family protein [Streptantibioticus silvisoli]MDI5970198.1 NlpC/P60 family protein [Streptantibioticus silvisoli]
MASHRRPARPGIVRAGKAAVLSAAAVAVAASAAVPAGAAPRATPADVRSRVGALYEQAERATEDYDAAQEQESRLRGRLDAVQDELARGQAAVNRMSDALAVVSGAQYRDGGVDPSLALLVSSDPAGYLDRASDLARAEGLQAGRLDRLRDAQRALAQQRAEAGGEIAQLDQVRRRLAARKQAVRDRLERARRLLATLTVAQRDAIGYGAAADGRTAPAGRVPDLPDLPASSDRAAEALAAARSALGLPYLWGGTGPGAFDCSGLMYWSYRHAGVTLPRTSQEQLGAGTHVPLDQARPGDLVVYRDNASHVAMYVGGGEVIHAPYPGARVRYDPVNMMPINAIVRP